MSKTAKQGNLFLIYPCNIEFIKKKAKKPYVGGATSPIIWLMMLMILTLIFISTLAIIKSAANVFSTLLTESDTVLGLVTDKYTENIDELERFIVYEYTVDGTTYFEQAIVNETIYDTHQINGTIEVIFSPQNPEINVLDWQPQLIYIAGAIATIMLSILVIAILFIVYRIKQRNNLIHNGKPIRGYIEAVDQYEDADEDIRTIIRYVFTSPLSKKTIKAKHTLINDIRRSMDGMDVAILYLNDRNYELL